jgi:putative glutamine amidotransferase
VHEVDGLDDHREDKELPLDAVRSGARRGSLPGSLLRSRWWTGRSESNWQGVDRLGPDLAIEARATDGLVEAFRVSSAPSFALAVQWHPEWKVMSNPFSSALFAEFGKAARAKSKNS